MPKTKTKDDPTLIRVEIATAKSTIGHLHDTLERHLLQASIERSLSPANGSIAERANPLRAIRVTVSGRTKGQAKTITLTPLGPRTKRGRPVRTTIMTPRRPDVRHDWTTASEATEFAVDQASAWARVERERRQLRRTKTK